MVRFSCFSTHPVNRSKTTNQHTFGTLHAYYQSVTQDQSIKIDTGFVHSNPMLHANDSSCKTMERNTSLCSQGVCWRSDDRNVKIPEDNKEMLKMLPIKKSHSLGNMMEKGSGFSGDGISEGDEIDNRFSFDYLNGWNMKGVAELFDGNIVSSELFHYENDGKNYHNEQKKNDLVEPLDLLRVPRHNESLFSVEVLKLSDPDQHADIYEQSTDHIADYRYSSGNLPTLARSSSAANLRLKKTESSEGAISHRLMLRRSHSVSDLNNLSGLEAKIHNGEKSFDSGVTFEKNIIVSFSNVKPGPDVEGNVMDYYHTEEECISLDRSIMGHDHDTDDDYKKSGMNDDENKKGCQQESSHYNWDQLTPEEFNMRRVEHWITQIGIHDDLIVEELGESSSSASKEDSQILVGVDPPKPVYLSKPDARTRLAMEVAYNYTSSLTAASSSAQLGNIGLVAIPVLSSFVGLRVINLSGNGIVRVTPGSLPKGLHMLNLSKNSISTIEGLRDLSRLRVLDISYNRIARIGHGLASCSSIKELYLAGNKISEVEGLHRLLKLNVIDLRFNKISTANALGQLAANYSSLQAINLEGNPAQKNVGDEQLKKSLLALLPNLVYYNKQAIRIGSKEVQDPTTRAAAARFDRVVRSDHKLPRRGSHGSGLHKLASIHGRQSSAGETSTKLPKDRRVRLQLPPVASKLTNWHVDTREKLLGLNTNDAMKRSRSIEALGSHFKS